MQPYAPEAYGDVDYNVDPRDPTNLLARQFGRLGTGIEAGLPGGVGAVGSINAPRRGNIGSLPLQQAYPSGQPVRGSSYSDYATSMAHLQKAHPMGQSGGGGLIGEVSTSGSLYNSNAPSTSYLPGSQQLRSSNSFGNGSINSAPIGGTPLMGQLMLNSRHSLGTSSSGGSQYGGIGQAQRPGPPIGQASIGQSGGYGSGGSGMMTRQQALGNTLPAGPPRQGAPAPNYAVQSAFVPASTSGHSFASGMLGPSLVHDSSAGLESQRVASNSTDGAMSMYNSISNLGSISHMGSAGLPAVVTNSLQSNSTNQRGSQSMPSKVKAVCSSGGHFVKLNGGGFEYEGGETRLIALPNYCSFMELTEALERIAGTAAAFSSASSEQSPSIKYQLPSEPNVYVDLVDDEDTHLMFDEWNDYQQLPERVASAKLHLFVDWHRRALISEASLPKGRLTNVPSTESIDTRSSAERITSAGSVEAIGEGQARSGEVHRPSEDTPKSSSTPHNAYEDIAERMEVISPADVTLAKFLGSGGYGEVYLGKWHSSEAAIKCLNPSMFYNGDGGVVSQAAITELIREADLLGSLRHPNVVWVYGIVLPMPDDHLPSADSGDAVEMATAAAQGHPGQRNGPGPLRPPAIVTEFMSQGSLKGALQRKADIVQGALIRVLIAMDAAKGMEYLHSKRIVHFDLKSANLLLGYRDRRAICKVADFGLSKQKRETYVSGVSSQRGTLPWIAPEIIKTPHAVTEKVDVFSFGVVLWELWTGKEPYDGLNYHALLHQITSSDVVVRPALPGSPDWDPEVGPEPAPGYRALMERCWLEAPAGRPSFSEIVRALKDMATALRPQRRPRPPSSNAGSSQPGSSTPAPVPTPLPQPPPQETEEPAAPKAEEPQ